MKANIIYIDKPLDSRAILVNLEFCFRLEFDSALFQRCLFLLNEQYDSENNPSPNSLWEEVRKSRCTVDIMFQYISILIIMLKCD